MTKTNSLLYGIVIALVLTIVYLMGSQVSRVFAGAPSGIPATIATSSLMMVGSTSPVTLIATSSCSARIITTYATPVTLTFTDYLAQSPTATFGHLQAASTTVVYDSGQYGCGKVKAYGFEQNSAIASSSITITDSR